MGEESGEVEECKQEWVSLAIIGRTNQAMKSAIVRYNLILV